MRLYDGLAAIERDPVRADAFRAIASNERRHAFIWAMRLRSAGSDVPAMSAPRWRVRAVLAAARVFGTKSVSSMVKALEGDELSLYEGQEADLEMQAMAADEREHAAIWKRLDMGMPGVEPGSEEAAAAAAVSVRDESWHRAAGQSGALRAAVFGINDGLVSNLALVMGFAGAETDNAIIVLAGVAGLLAGAFSMGAGEYVSMRSQRELFERQIDVEREKLRFRPDQEREELAAIYRAKGLSDEEADLVARRLMQDPAHALDTKIREDLGLDPDELGSPWGAAIYSFLAFSLGAIVPLAPVPGHGRRDGHRHRGRSGPRLALRRGRPRQPAHRARAALQRPSPGVHRRGGRPGDLHRGQPHRRQRRRLTARTTATCRASTRSGHGWRPRA